MAMRGVPEPYLEAWAHLQVRKPMQVSDERWRQAINDAGRFPDARGALAAGFQWAPADLFDGPARGRDIWPCVDLKRSQG
jgi:hypothetical protein